LEKSLTEFDGMLLREQQVLEEKRAEAEAAGGSAGGTSGASGGGKAFPAEGAPSQAEAGTDRSGGGGAGASQPEGEEEPLDEEMASRVPSDVGDGSDDDIVARQLREAAMKEEDPELREKLWDEYRRYKNGGKG
jgi:hypothetical protein